MSLHLNDFAGQPILTYVHTPSPGYLSKSIAAHSHYEVDDRSG
ncbi:MAG: hypothetical protein ACOC6C_02470 [Verrucomicrobiota bacterium]